MTDSALTHARQLSPLRNTSTAASIDELVAQQLTHFAIEPDTPFGQTLGRIARDLYSANAAAHELWTLTVESLQSLDRTDRLAYFNAKRFLCFQLAKILDTLQNPLRRAYQSLTPDIGTRTARGPYPLFDNVTAIFSSTPVITRTATYLYACSEWVEDAFKGKELLHEIYSRLLNPTSVSLANQIVDLEAGELAAEYFAWNFNSGMAAIDTTLAHLLGNQDIVLSSRNIYGGTYQLLHDWYGRPSNLDVAIHWFDGYGAEDFRAALALVQAVEAERLARGRRIYVYLESPCNPHGYVLDVRGICRIAHEHGIDVICDSTVGTPFLHPVLRAPVAQERPDFVIHSYTKDLAGSGSTTAGVCIARNERMFVPKGQSVTAPVHGGGSRVWRWDETLFWNVYYVKGAFLDSDKAFEVLAGMRTLELRMLAKSINTIVLAQVLARHPVLRVSCPAVPGNPNAALCEDMMLLGLPAPLFTVDFEGGGSKLSIEREHFKRFFDALEPAFGLQVSLGQTGTVALCPALTSHSELSEEALRAAGIAPTTIRISVGLEDPRTLLAHLLQAAAGVLEPHYPGFVAGFPAASEVDALYRATHERVHRQFVASRPSMQDYLG